MLKAERLGGYNLTQCIIPIELLIIINWVNIIIRREVVIGHVWTFWMSHVHIYSIQGNLSTEARVRSEHKLLWESANGWKPSTKAENESPVQKLWAKLEHQDESGKSVSWDGPEHKITNVAGKGIINADFYTLIISLSKCAFAEWSLTRVE